MLWESWRYFQREVSGGRKAEGMKREGLSRQEHGGSRAGSGSAGSRSIPRCWQLRQGCRRARLLGFRLLTPRGSCLLGLLAQLGARRETSSLRL